MINGTIKEFLGFELNPETDHTEQVMARIIGGAKYVVEYGNGSTEVLFTSLRPGENFGWSIKVMQAAQAWLNAGGVIPEWVPPKPEEIRAFMPALTARQFRHGLLNTNTLPSEVDAIIAEIEDEFEREAARIDWEHANEFERLHPLVVAWGARLGYTPEVIDDLWEYFQTI
jgi:hypothetical protein